MRISLFWPNCSLHNGRWIKDEFDAFWVECTPLEFQEKVAPLIPDKLNRLPKRNEEYPNNYLLVSRDLSSITVMPWYYPISGHWNGDSPFEIIEPIEIEELNQIADIFLRRPHF